MNDLKRNLVSDMITEDYVSFETAKLLKEKGFDEKCMEDTMIDMSDIEKIRKFVKELQQDFISIQPKDCSLDLIKSYAGYAYLDKVLSFLDTLSVEPDKNLEEEMEEFFETMPVLEHENIFDETFQNIARHFAEWGAEHLRDSTKKIDKSMEEAAEEFAEQEWDGLHDTNGNALYTEDYIKYTFIAGAEWQKEQDEAEKNLKYFYGLDEGAKIMKEQMLKDAVECELVCSKERLAAILPMKEFRWTVGDKVRIVVLKAKGE